jgi:hypothetical protein
MSRLTLLAVLLGMLLLSGLASAPAAEAQGSWTCYYSFSQGSNSWSISIGVHSDHAIRAVDSSGYFRIVQITKQLPSIVMTALSITYDFQEGSFELPVSRAYAYPSPFNTPYWDITSAPSGPIGWSGTTTIGSGLVIGFITSRQSTPTYSGSAALYSVTISGTGTAPSDCPQPPTATPIPTATLTPSPTGGPMAQANATLSALPTYSALSGSATATPAPTIAWPTLTPDPRTTPVPWAGMGMIEITPGGPYDPPAPPSFDNPDLPGIETPNGFSGINDRNLGAFLVYLIDVAISFYKWFGANFGNFVRGARWFVIIMLTLYGIFWIWKGSRFRPPDTESQAEINEPGFFLRTFRYQGRYFGYSQRRLDAQRRGEWAAIEKVQRATDRRAERNARVAERALKKMNKGDPLR